MAARVPRSVSWTVGPSARRSVTICPLESALRARSEPHSLRSGRPMASRNSLVSHRRTVADHEWRPTLREQQGTDSGGRSCGRQRALEVVHDRRPSRLLTADDLPSSSPMDFRECHLCVPRLLFPEPSGGHGCPRSAATFYRALPFLAAHEQSHARSPPEGL